MEMGKGTKTPCLICEKSMFYLEMGEHKFTHIDMINNGNSFKIIGGYGSSFDGYTYHAIICDDCLDQAIQRNRIQWKVNGV